MFLVMLSKLTLPYINKMSKQVNYFRVVGIGCGNILRSYQEYQTFFNNLLTHIQNSNLVILVLALTRYTIIMKWFLIFLKPVFFFVLNTTLYKGKLLTLCGFLKEENHKIKAFFYILLYTPNEQTKLINITNCRRKKFFCQTAFQ